MPIYEFLCHNCSIKSSVLVRNWSGTSLAKCPNCGASDLERLVSSFAFHKSIKTIYEEAGEPEVPGPDYYKDPRNIGRTVEKRFKEAGMDLPPQLQEEIGAAREGEMPDTLKEMLDK